MTGPWKQALLGVVLLAAARAQGVEAAATRYFTEAIERREATAGAFATLEDGELRTQQFFGSAIDISLWRAGSVTKSITAVAVLQLVESGALDLDADVNAYLKSFQVPDNGMGPVTLRHLLGHTSGLDDRFIGSAFLDSAGAQPPLTETMRQWLPGRVHAPGAVRLYTNFGYGLVGAVLEAITGERYETHVQRRVLEPLGMLSSTLEQPLPIEFRARLVPTLERSLFGSIREAPVLYHRSTSASGLSTSLGDLIRLSRFVSSAAEAAPSVVRPETLRLMLEQGFGFGFGTVRDEKYWSASGDLGGHHAVVLWFPEHNRSMVIVAAGPSANLAWNLVPRVMETWFAPTDAPSGATAERNFAGQHPARYPRRERALRLDLASDAPAELLEHTPWYETGVAAIAAYFAFLLLAALSVARARGPEFRMLRWTAWAILAHSVAWLGAVLAADPQTLILGVPWSVSAALALGWLVAPAWLGLAWSVLRASRGRVILAAATAIFGLYLPFAAYWRVLAGI